MTGAGRESWEMSLALTQRFLISETKARSDKKHNTFYILLSFVLTSTSEESLRIKS